MKEFWHRLVFSLSVLGSSHLCLAIPPNKKLHEINQQIESTQAELSVNQQAATQLTEELKKNELQISAISLKLEETNRKITAQQQQLGILQKQEKQLLQSVEKQQKALSAVLTSAYKNPQVPYLKLLLNQEDPSQFSRMETYYRRYTQAQTELIQQTQKTLEQLKNTREKIRQTLSDLRTSSAEQTAQKQTLNQTQQARQQVLEKRQNQIKTQQQRLAQLKEDKQALEALINRLKATAVSDKTKGATLQEKWDFLPVNGSIKRSFGSRETPQSLPEQGIFIEAAVGAPVKSIAKGKVIYADWLKGFGLLLILDHGSGYMSLYSHCNSLYYKVGDLVEKGSLIATAGNSGGFQEAGLAFEIRQNGKPINPLKFLKKAKK